MEIVNKKWESYTVAELEKIQNEYPYFTAINYLLAKKSNRSEILETAAAFVNDRISLKEYIVRKDADLVISLSENEPLSNLQIEISKEEEEPIVLKQDEVFEAETPIELITEEKSKIEFAQKIEIEELVKVEESTILTEHANEKIEEYENVLLEISNQDKESLTIKEDLISEQSADEIEEEKTVVISTEDKMTFEEWAAFFEKNKASVIKVTANAPIQNDDDAQLNELIESSVPLHFFAESIRQETNYAKGLEDFIAKQKERKMPVQQSQNKKIVSETLAKLYEKQGFTDKAIEVYQKLILKNPEKSTYFAAQIKKLK